MKTIEQVLADYAAYHRDPMNRLTHYIGVPAITFSILVPMAWLRIDLGTAWLSLAMAFVLGVLIYYFLLDLFLAFIMVVVILFLLLAAEWVATAYSVSAGGLIFGIFFVGGWGFQLLGHAIEGRRPALADNFLQIFSAPLYLVAEACFALGLRSELKKRVEQMIVAAK